MTRFSLRWRATRASGSRRRRFAGSPFSRATVNLGVAVILGAALVCGGSGCGDDDPAPSRVAPDAGVMAAVASDLALVVGASLQQYTLAGLVERPAQNPGLRPTAKDTLLEGLVDCPLVIHHRDEQPPYYELRYGTGCVSDLDSLDSAGSVLFTISDRFPLEGFDLSSVYEDFARDGRRVDGVVDVLGAGGRFPLFLETSALELAGRGGSTFFSLESNVIPAEDPCGGSPSFCEGWRLHAGSGQSVSSLLIYQVSLQDTLVISGCHPYPVRGVIAVTSSGTHPALIDFGDGACDDIVTLTVEGLTQTITLGYGS